MKRRTLLSLTLLLVGISGCIGSDKNTDNSEGHSENNSTTEDNRIESNSWQAGTTLVAVDVHEDFSGDVLIKADCRNEDYDIRSGEELTIDRKENGESCSIQLLLDDDIVYDTNIGSIDKYGLTVNKDGEIIEDVETV